MRASSISRSRSAGRGIRGRRSPSGSGGGVSFSARIARRLPLDVEEVDAARALATGIATILVVADIVISPAGSACTVTASRFDEGVSGRCPFDGCNGCEACVSDHCATAQGEVISRPYNSSETLFACIIRPRRDTISLSRSSRFSVEMRISLIVSKSLMRLVIM